MTTSTTTDSDQPSAASESSESTETSRQPRKRRGRRGGRGRGGGQGSTPPSDSPETSSADKPGDRESGSGARSGGRGRGRGRSGEGGGGDQGSDTSAQPKKRRPRPAPTVDSENWEEIFENQTFADLGLRGSVLKGVEEAGFTHPTKIQGEMIPLVLAGRDVLGQSRTGTGKTAAFGLPLYHMATRDLPFQSFILAPTRELAIQIAAELADLGQYTPIRVSAVYGGQRIETQTRNLERGPEIIVATPGRLMDMVQRGHLHFKNVRFVVLDEVDRMLDIGFREDIKKILSRIRSDHQTVFVSATISDEIEKLARSYMHDPAKLVTTGGSLTVSLVEQHYFAVQPWDKSRLLVQLLTREEPDVTLVFCRMKRTVDKIARLLKDKGIDAHAIHGDMYQGKRNSVMERFRTGQLGVLVASDLAARGLDVDDITHVVNYDLPDDPEVYIHRIGRTARAGRGGVAWSLVTPDQGGLLTQIEVLANTHIPQQSYPDFDPGPIPRDIRAQKEVDEKRIERMRSVSRFGEADLPVASKAATADPLRFPGGLVPTKYPPKKMGGRVRTARSMKKVIADRLEGADGAPKEDGPPKDKD